jgi:site-specific DNA recombinase
VEINIVNEVAALRRLSVAQLRQRFAELFGEATHASNRTWLTKRILWRMQALAEGDLSQRARRRAAELARDADLRLNAPHHKETITATSPDLVNVPAPVDPRLPPPGTILTRPYKGQLVQVQVLTEGFAYAGRIFPLAQRRGQNHHRQPHQWLPLLLQYSQPQQGDNMNTNGKKSATTLPLVRCALYTRKSTGEGLEPEFNSLDAQRESAEAFVRSQVHEGWTCLPTRYDDGGFTGDNMERPALQRLLDDIRAGKIDCVICYKVDRLSRSLLDFDKMIESAHATPGEAVALFRELAAEALILRLAPAAAPLARRWSWEQRRGSDRDASARFATIPQPIRW